MIGKCSFFTLVAFFALQLRQVQAQATFKDVASIFYNNCATCHHSGGIQFPLTKYSEITPHGAAIVSALNDGRMPPWPPDPNYKHYVKERVISAADKAALISWINNGMLAGDTTLAPPVPVFGTYQLFGTPDLVLNLPQVTSTSSSTDKYICVNVPVNISQDRYIRAFEYVPGNPAIIHHAVITIDSTGTAVDDLSGNCFNFQGQTNIGDYAPGMGPTVLPGVSPTKFGFRLKAGSKISFQLHIPAGTAGQTDNSQLRIYFYPIGETGIRTMNFETVLQNWSFSIPPNTVVTSTAKYPAGSAGIPVDISLYASFPHSHKTCTSIINYAYKNTDTIPLIKIPSWNFHWQGQYVFKNLVKFPATYHLFSAHVFDNTVNNPENPNPNVTVSAGTNTDDEMLFDSFLFSIYQNGDENVSIENLLLNDPIFYPTGITNYNHIQTFNLYPNPSSSQVTLDFGLSTAQWVSVKMFNQLGQEVNTWSQGVQTSGEHLLKLPLQSKDGLSLPTGTYMVLLNAGKDSKTALLNVIH